MDATFYSPFVLITVIQSKPGSQVRNINRHQRWTISSTMQQAFHFNESNHKLRRKLNLLPRRKIILAFTFKRTTFDYTSKDSRWAPIPPLLTS